MDLTLLTKENKIQPQLLLRRGWPHPFLQQLEQGQNLNPDNTLILHCMQLIIEISIPRNINLVPGLLSQLAVPLCHFHCRLKAALYKLNSQKRRIKLFFKGTYQQWDSVALPGEAQKRQLKLLSFQFTFLLFGYRFIGKNGRRIFANSLLDEMQIEWDKSKRSKTGGSVLGLMLVIPLSAT